MTFKRYTRTGEKKQYNCAFWKDSPTDRLYVRLCWLPERNLNRDAVKKKVKNKTTKNQERHKIKQIKKGDASVRKPKRRQFRPRKCSMTYRDSIIPSWPAQLHVVIANVSKGWDPWPTRSQSIKKCLFAWPFVTTHRNAYLMEKNVGTFCLCLWME